MEVIGIILFCLISIWLGVGSSWLIICESKSYKPKPSITKQKMRLEKEFKLLDMSQNDIGVILKTVREVEDE
jgi:hypothetical protein